MKKLWSILLSLCLLCGASTAFAAEGTDNTETAETVSETQAMADALNLLGLFRGTDLGYELDRALNRAEALTLVVRMVGAEEEAARQEAMQNNQQYTGPGSTATGSYIWPCPSSTYVTSRYGYRTHPIFGDERPHSGIDISANEGATIIAADSGTVSVATYSSSYGNYVTIYHSNGTYTLYAHMSSLAVSAGQTVSQGGTIGYAGSTGWATGPHLHFEIRSNGGTVDPLAYFSNYSLAPDA